MAACRFCDATLDTLLIDLGTTPLANSFPSEADLAHPEPRYPLRVLVCGVCRLAQVEESVPPQRIFPEYAYFSSYSSSWLDHARRYAEQAIRRFGLGPGSRVVEVASNDGYLLRNFVAAGVPALGIDPAANVARAAEAAGVPTLVRFFGLETAEALRAEGTLADLLIGNNVLAHVPALNDFVAGLACLLAPGGVVSLEFPHLLRLLEEVQFDTIYHEHYSYFSLLTAERVLAAHGLMVFDLEELTTHGGSLRLFARHAGAEAPAPTGGLEAVRAAERRAGLDRDAPYAAFAAAAEARRCEIAGFLERAHAQGLECVAYGAAAKGNTLLNAVGAGPDLLGYVVDRNPYKQGRYKPGTRLPIVGPERLAETRPDRVLILPWNLRDEIVAELPEVRSWGGRFVVPMPVPRVLD